MSENYDNNPFHNPFDTPPGSPSADSFYSAQSMSEDHGNDPFSTPFETPPGSPSADQFYSAQDGHFLAPKNTSLIDSFHSLSLDSLAKPQQPTQPEDPFATPPAAYTDAVEYQDPTTGAIHHHSPTQQEKSDSITQLLEKEQGHPLQTPPPRKRRRCRRFYYEPYGHGRGSFKTAEEFDKNALRARGIPLHRVMVFDIPVDEGDEWEAFVSAQGSAEVDGGEGK